MQFLTQMKPFDNFEIHEAILFVIELTDSIFEPLPELHNRSNLLEILKCLSELISRFITVAPNTGIGCYFHNSSKSNDGIDEFLPLRNINVKDMKKLSDFVEDIEKERIDLKTILGFSNDRKNVSIEELVTFIQQVFFQDIADQKPYNYKRVFIFTDNDKPLEYYDTEAKTRIKSIVRDIYDLHVSFNTFFIDTKQKPFDNSFYDDILRVDFGNDNGDTNETDFNNEKYEFDGPNLTPIMSSAIKSKILRTKEVKRVAFQCPLILNKENNFTIGIKGYTIVSHEKVGTRYKLFYEHDQIRQEAYSKRKYLNSKTGEEISKDKLKYLLSLGDTYVDINEKDDDKDANSDEQENFNKQTGISDDQNIYNDFENIGSFLSLIGFRDTQLCIKFYNNIDKSTFITPDEKQFQGSNATMTSLYKNLSTKKKSAIVWGKLKTNSKPGVYILSPSTFTDTNEGFYLYRLPFLEEIRKFPTLVNYKSGTDLPEYTGLLKITEAIMQYFNLKQAYKPSDFKNPNIEKYYNTLHDYLLQTEVNDTQYEIRETIKNDDTLKKISRIRNKIEMSSVSENETEQRLSRYLEVWNKLYSKIEQDFDTSGTKKSTKKTI